MTRRDCLILLRAIGDVAAADFSYDGDRLSAVTALARAGADMLAQDLESGGQMFRVDVALALQDYFVGTEGMDKLVAHDKVSAILDGVQ